MYSRRRETEKVHCSGEWQPSNRFHATFTTQINRSSVQSCDDC